MKNGIRLQFTVNGTYGKTNFKSRNMSKNNTVGIFSYVLKWKLISIKTNIIENYFVYACKMIVQPR